MSHSSAAVRPLSAPALWGLLAALYLVWPAVGLPSFLPSALSALLPLPLLFAFDSLLSFAVFYVGMGLLLQLAAGRRPTWRMALTAVLAALGLVLVQALVSDLSGLFLSADSGFMAVAALSLVKIWFGWPVWPWCCARRCPAGWGRPGIPPGPLAAGRRPFAGAALRGGGLWNFLLPACRRYGIGWPDRLSRCAGQPAVLVNSQQHQQLDQPGLA